MIDLYFLVIFNYEMGLVFEYLICKFVEFVNDMVGEFFMLCDVVCLVMMFVFFIDYDVFVGDGVICIVYDCVVGIGGFLLMVMEQVQEWNFNVKIIFYVQEFNFEIYVICVVDKFI